ncbi:MAG: O-antigen ligase family protein, partial [Chthoniobacteraceae bacterium]
KKRLWMLPLIGLVGIVGAIVVAKPMTATLLDRVGTGTYASSGAQRTVSARLAAAMIADNPLLGVGYMGYERMLERYGGDQYFDLAHPDGASANANNQILQSLTDSGIIGLLAFGLLVFCAARLLWRTAARCDDRLIGTFFFAACLWLITQLFGNVAAVWLNPSSFVARLTWIALGLAVAVARMIPVEEARAAAMARASTEPQPLAA